MRKTVLSLLALVTMVTLLIAGCSPSASSPASPPAPTTAPASTAPTAAPASGQPAAAPTSAPVAAKPTAAPVKAMKLKLATSYNPGADAIPSSIQYFTSELKNRTNGAIETEIFWGEQLAKNSEIPNALKSGLAQMAFINMPNYPELVPLVASGYAYLGIVGAGYDTALKAYKEMSKEFPEWDQQFAKLNQINVFGISSSAGKVIISTKPINNLADLKGKKISSGASEFRRLVGLMGATAVTVPAVEAYDALSKGVVDGAHGTAETVRRYKHFEIAKYMYVIYSGAQVSYGLNINLDTWKQLSPETQKLIMDLGQETAVRAHKQVSDSEESDYAFLKQQGVTISYQDRAAMNNFLDEKGTDMYNEIMTGLQARGYPNAKAIIDRYAAILKQ